MLPKLCQCMCVDVTKTTVVLCFAVPYSLVSFAGHRPCSQVPSTGLGFIITYKDLKTCSLAPLLVLEAIDFGPLNFTPVSCDQSMGLNMFSGDKQMLHPRRPEQHFSAHLCGFSSRDNCLIACSTDKESRAFIIIVQPRTAALPHADPGQRRCRAEIRTLAR
jgi:hypothetical protein